MRRLGFVIAIASSCVNEPVACDAQQGQACAKYNFSCTTTDGVDCICGSDLTWYCGLWQDLAGHYDLSVPDLNMSGG